MPRIAAAAQLAPGTLYLYFPSKQALYAELLAEGYGILERRLAQSAQAQLPPERQAAALIDAFFAFAREFPEYFDVIFFVLQREGSDREGSLELEQARRLKSAEDRCKAIAGQVLRRAAGASVRKADLSVEATWAMLAGVIFFFRTMPDFEAVADQAKRLVLSAIVGGTRDSAPSRGSP